jgi:hypothetical protein
LGLDSAPLQQDDGEAVREFDYSLPWFREILTASSAADSPECAAPGQPAAAFHQPVPGERTACDTRKI